MVSHLLLLHRNQKRTKPTKDVKAVSYKKINTIQHYNKYNNKNKISKKDPVFIIFKFTSMREIEGCEMRKDDLPSIVYLALIPCIFFVILDRKKHVVSADSSEICPLKISISIVHTTKNKLKSFLLV